MSHTATVPGQAAARDVLTHTEAVARAARVSDVSYRIELDIVAGQSTYRGKVSVSFADGQGGSLFLDFRGRTIERLELNGDAIQPDWSGYRLTLPEHVVAGRNELLIEYINDFDVTGDGFHRFVDPEDGAEYVYTNFEPYEAHRLYPCFDQPDIKATYRFVVSAPAEWEVFSNAPLAKATPTEDGRVQREFEQTEIFSTYLTALAGGPYVVRRVQHGELDLGLYARRSMERYLDEQAPEVLEITAQGLDFYAQLFGRPYPFSKYDQVFVPEYNSGAMENVGCVTYNEAYLFRDQATENERLDRGETFLHELAHMWFGNLVTMRWWDDLWLNESFATYISYLALTEATRFTNAWKVFNSVIKRWAYQQDQLPTTHPIAGTAADTEIAFLNFDGITYGKGASVLRQLVKHIGRDTFESGMQLYFRRHAWSNATVADFLRCLEDAGQMSLTDWSERWLRTSSVNTLAAIWSGSDGKVDALAIEQTAPEDHPTLRPHSIEIALGYDGAGRLEVNTLAASIDGPLTQIEVARGAGEPQLVFPNHGDYTYAKVRLDGQSVAYVSEHLGRVDDPLLRNLLWASLWEMVRDARLRSTDYLGICTAQLPLETDHDVLDVVLERVAINIARYIPESVREQSAHAWFELALESLGRAGGDARIMWARSAIKVAAIGADVARLMRLADGAEKIGSFEFDQEMRWAVAIKAIAFGLDGAEQLLARQGELDPSDRGRRALLQAEAARPSEDAKQEAWERIHGEGYGSFYLTRAAMMGFFWPQQSELLQPYVDDFFDRVEGVFETKDHPFARAYMFSMYPAFGADPKVLARSRALLSELDGTLPTLSRQLAESAAELDRQIKVRAFAEAG